MMLWRCCVALNHQRMRCATAVQSRSMKGLAVRRWTGEHTISAAGRVTIFLTASVSGASAALWPPQLLARAARTHAISGTREQKQDSKRSGKIVSLNAVAFVGEYCRGTACILEGLSQTFARLLPHRAQSRRVVVGAHLVSANQQENRQPPAPAIDR